MKKEIYILIAVILIVILIIGLLIWSNYNKTIERKYQACQDKCDAYAGFGISKYTNSDYKACNAECREKYGK